MLQVRNSSQKSTDMLHCFKVISGIFFMPPA